MRLSVLGAACLLLCATASADLVLVSSRPAGAEVWVAPPDQPGIYHKGATPCVLRLPSLATPYRLLVRSSGYFPVYRTLTREDLVVDLVLRPLGEVKAWQAVPVLWVGERLRWSAEGSTAVRFAGLPGYPDLEATWSPDAEAVAACGQAWHDELVPLGLAREEEEERALCDLWYAPRRGPAVRVWRYLSAPHAGTRFSLDAAFSPDGRWLAYSAPDRTTEHLELYSVLTRRHRLLARERGATLYCPSFSADGRRLAWLRRPVGREEESEEAPRAELQVAQWNGEDRRTVARDACPALEATFSPDGSRLAYATAEGSIAVVPVSGGEARVVLRASGWGAGCSPRWSADGATVAADFVRLTDTCGGPGGGGRRGLPTDRAHRVLWTRLDGGGSGAIPAVTLHGWHDAESLDVYADGYCRAAAAGYQRLLWCGLDGRGRGVLREGGPVLHHLADYLDGTRAAALETTADGRQAVIVVSAADEAVRRFAPRELAEALDLGWLEGEALWLRMPEGSSSPGYRLHLPEGTLTPLRSLPPPAAEKMVLQDPRALEARLQPQPWHGRVTGAWSGSLAPTIPGGGERR